MEDGDSRYACCSGNEVCSTEFLSGKFALIMRMGGHEAL